MTLLLIGKGKGSVPQWGLGEVLISQTLAVEPVGEWTTESVTHGQCDARPTVTFPAAEPIEYQGHRSNVKVTWVFWVFLACTIVLELVRLDSRNVIR